ncbi:uncharacterized protein [Palaemon carinicauda]|uniref:uncharacterized protein n=1 Tax=Palaemon carinicauda TaxID=392227 RepID=UPI0035B5E4AD
MYHLYPTYNEFVTLVQEAECIINNRPLVYLDVNDFTDTPLTLSHLLYGRTLSLAPQVLVTDLHDPTYREGNSLPASYQKLTNMLRVFLKRWTQDYVNSLLERHIKNNRIHTVPPKNGDFCLLILDEVNREDYPMARILETYPGQDGHIRSVKMCTPRGIYVRPINRFIPLEIIVAGPYITELEQGGPDSLTTPHLPDPPSEDPLIDDSSDDVAPLPKSDPVSSRGQPRRAAADKAHALFQKVL